MSGRTVPVKGFAVAVATLALALVAPAQAGAAPAGADDAPTITPRTYKNVMLWFTNDSAHTVHLKVVNGSQPFSPSGTEVRLYPGETKQLYGRDGSWQIHFDVSWCADQTGLGCAEKLTAVVKAQNYAIGYPSIRIDKDDHSFKSMERYTFEKAYGPAAKRGVAKFKTLREVDTDLKRFRMNFSYAAPAS